VITTPTCGYSRALAPEWVEELEAAADSAGVHVVSAWIAFGDSAEVPLLVRHVDSRLPPIWTTPDDLGAFELALGLEGVPHTLVVRPDGRIGALVSGNAVVSAAALAAGCRQ